MIDVKFILINKLLVLAFILLVFLFVLMLRFIFRKEVSMTGVVGTIKLCIAGMILLFFEVELSTIPIYGGIVRVLQELIAVLCFAKLLVYLIVDVYMFYRHRKSVPTFLRDIISLCIYLVFAMASLRLIFKIELSSVITTSAVLTAAIAFAMQNTLSNVVSGFSIQVDRNLKRNTWITLDEKKLTGEVVNVGFRYTTLRTLENQTVIVPNNIVLQNVITSHGNAVNGEATALTLSVGLGYDLSPEKSRKLLEDVLKNAPEVARTPEPAAFIAAFGESTIDYKLRFFVVDYSRRDEIRDDVLTRVWYALAREGQSIPYPHRQIIRTEQKPPFVLDRLTITSSMKETELLSSLSSGEIDTISSAANLKVFGAGEKIVQENDEGDSLFIVLRGVVDVRIGDAVVGSIAEKGIFGEMSLLTGERRKATVIARDEVHLVEITKSSIEPVIKTNASFVDRLSSIIVERETKNIEMQRSLEKGRVAAEKKEEFMNKLKKFFGI